MGGEPIERIGFAFHKGMYLRIGLGLVVGGLAAGAVIGVGLAAGQLGGPSSAGADASSLARSFAQAILLFGAFACAAETAFRGVVQRLFTGPVDVRAAIAAGAAAQALTVGLVLPGQPAIGVLGTALIGAASGLAYHRSGSLWLSAGLSTGWLVASGWGFGFTTAGQRFEGAFASTWTNGAAWVTGGGFGLESGALGVVGAAVALALAAVVPVSKEEPAPAPGEPQTAA
jgi:membrane protease YdiL (CAAX protease family)